MHSASHLGVSDDHQVSIIVEVRHIQVAEVNDEVCARSGLVPVLTKPASLAAVPGVLSNLFSQNW